MEMNLNYTTYVVQTNVGSSKYFMKDISKYILQEILFAYYVIAIRTEELASNENCFIRNISISSAKNNRCRNPNCFSLPLNAQNVH